MNIFVGKDETLSFDFFVGQALASNKPKYIVAETADEVLKLMAQQGLSPVGEVEKHLAKFRYPTFKDSAEIVDSSLALVEGQLTFRSTTLRLNRLAQLITDWSFKNDKGVFAPLNIENVGNLRPEIATYLSDVLEAELGLV